MSLGRGVVATASDLRPNTLLHPEVPNKKEYREK